MRNLNEMIELYQGFMINSDLPVDNRLVLNQTDLDNLGQHEDEIDSPYYLAKWPEKYFFLFEGDGQLYEFIREGTAVPFTCKFTKVTFKYDDITIKENGNGELFVPIDNASIVVSEGLLKATAKPVKSGEATDLVLDGNEYKVNVLYDDRTVKLVANKLTVPIDEKTIIVSEGKLVAVPEPLEGGKATEARYDGDKEVIDVRVDSESVVVNANNDLAVKLGVALALNNGVSVQFKGAIKHDSTDNKLFVDTDNLTILVSSEGKLEMPLKAGKALEIAPDFKKIDVLVDEETVKVNADNKLEVQYDEDRALDLDADEGLFVKVDDVTIKTSEGKLQAQYKAGDALELTGTEFDVLFDGKTIKLNSSGELEAVYEPLKDGHATHLHYVGDSEQVDVLHDETLKLVAGNKLRVNLDEKTLRDSAGELFVNVDNNTLFYDSSEGVLKAKAVAVNAGHAMDIQGNVLNVLFDDKTVKENADKKLYVPYDDKTLIISEGKFTLNKDNDTIYFSTSEGVVKAKQMHIDEKTIVWHNDVEDSYIETRIGGWAEPQQSYSVVNDPNASYSGDKRELYYDLDAGASSLKLNDRLTISYMLYDGSTDTTEAIYHTKGTVDCIECYLGDVKVEGKIVSGRWVFTRIDGTPEFPSTWTGGAGNSPFNMKIESPSGIYHYDPIDGNFIPVDGDTIVLNASGQLRAVAKDLIAGEAININPADFNSINVKYDHDSIVLNSDGELEAVNELPPYTAAEDDKFLRVTSEGLLEWAPAGKVDDVLFDGVTVVGADKVARFVKASTSEFGLVKFDGDEIIVNSAGQLELGHRYVEDFILTDSQGTRTLVDSENKVELDLSNYSLIPETANKIQLFMDSVIPTSEGSEGSTYRITAKLLDKNGLVIDESNVLDLPIESTVVDGHVEIDSEITYLVLTLHNGKQVRIPMSAVVGGFIDTRSDYVGTNSIYGTKNFAGELQNYGVEVITQVQVDNKTILWNDSEVYLEVKLPDEGDAIEIKDLGTKYELNVKYDDETLKLDAIANELYLNNDEKTIVYNATKDKVEVPIDEVTLIVDTDDKVKANLDKKTLIVSEGKIAANLDYRTVIYDDSEKLVKLPIDEVTIFVNSEGLLEAAGLDVKAGKAIEIEDAVEAGLPVKKLNVMFDSESILLNSAGELYVPIDKDSIIISEGLLTVDQYTVEEIKALWHNVCVEGEA